MLKILQLASLHDYVFKLNFHASKSSEFLPTTFAVILSAVV